jgi:hypothetical protein
VQAGGHDLVDLAAARGRGAHGVQRVYPHRGGAQIRKRSKATEQLVHLAQAHRDGTREAGIEQQKAHDLGRLHAARIGPPEGMIAGGRAQQRVPLAGVHLAIGFVGRRHQAVVVDVQQPRGLVRALQIFADLIEIPALIPIISALHDAGVQLAVLFDGGTERRQL